MSLEAPNSPSSIEGFLQEASERLQFVREYAGVLVRATLSGEKEDLARLHQAAQMLVDLATGQGYPLFTEIAGINWRMFFQYACNTEAKHGYLRPADGIYLRRGHGAGV